MSSKTLYRVRNWRTYSQALVDRGNITVRFAPEAIKGWQSDLRHNGRRRPEECSDAAIEGYLVLRSLFRLPLRATQGFVESIHNMMMNRRHARSIRNLKIDSMLPAPFTL